MSIEKTWLPPEARIQPDGSTKIVHPWEIKATGKDCMELKDAFKDSGPEMMHEGWKEWNSIGETTVTLPNGKTDVVRADKEHLYRSMPGFCERRVRPGITVSGFGGMKREGLTRCRIRYANGERIIEEAR